MAISLTGQIGGDCEDPCPEIDCPDDEELGEPVCPPTEFDRVRLTLHLVSGSLEPGVVFCTCSQTCSFAVLNGSYVLEGPNFEYFLGTAGDCNAKGALVDVCIGDVSDDEDYPCCQETRAYVYKIKLSGGVVQFFANSQLVSKYISSIDDCYGFDCDGGVQHGLTPFGDAGIIYAITASGDCVDGIDVTCQTGLCDESGEDCVDLEYFADVA
jgi:hypothetical protein